MSHRYSTWYYHRLHRWFDIVFSEFSNIATCCLLPLVLAVLALVVVVGLANITMGSWHIATRTRKVSLYKVCPFIIWCTDSFRCHNMIKILHHFKTLRWNVYKTLYDPSSSYCTTWSTTPPHSLCWCRCPTGYRILQNSIAGGSTVVLIY